MLRTIITGIGLATLSGCGFIEDIFGPRLVQVQLVNDGDFDVDATIFISDEQDILEDLLISLGTELNFTIPAGETVSFERDCGDLQAIIIDDADLEVIGQVGPETRSDLLRDGSDFSCGDTIVFTFTHSALLVDFDVDEFVQ